MVPRREVWVGFSGSRLLLTPSHDRWGPCYSFPDGPGGGSVPIAWDDAVHARIHPAGTAERVLAGWARGDHADRWVTAEDPADPRPERQRGAAVVVSAGKVLLIRYAPTDGDKYFIPGGGVEPGESPAEAAVRELREETGLTGAVGLHLATVYNRRREEHYFLVQPDGGGERAEPGDLAPGQTLEWVDVAALPATPVWPKRLAWRISHWHAHGWPEQPAVFADSSGALASPCTW